MTIAQHLLAIAEELERNNKLVYPRWFDALVWGFDGDPDQGDYIAAFRRAASLAEKDHTNG